MTKGFGTPKQPTEKEIDTFKNLIRVRQDYDAFCRYRDKLELKYGSKPIDNLLTDDPELFWEYREILPNQIREKLDRIVQPKAEEFMFGQFAEWGFEPGKDFSIGTHKGNRAFWLSERLRQRLEAEGFPIEEVLKKQPANTTIPDPIGQLDQHLGVPFTRNLVAALATTASTEDPKLTLVKLSYLCRGLDHANPQIKWFGFLVASLTESLGEEWNSRLDAAYQAMQQFFKNNPDATDADWCSEPSEGWWAEILCRSLELEPRYADLGDGKEEATIGVDDCRKLHQVWRGEKFTFLEMALALEKASKEHQGES